MAQDVTDEPQFLSTLPATQRDRRLARSTVIVSAAVFFAVVPFAKIFVGSVWAFIPIYESALVINDLITAVLLLGQFAILGTPSLAVLASGYLFTALMAAAHAFTFPGLFAPEGLFGAGPQSTAWLYVLWHVGFPLFVIAYALLNNRPRKATRGPRRNYGVSIVTSAAAACALAAASLVLVTSGHDLLPEIVEQNHYTSASFPTFTAVWAASLIALGVLWKHRSPSVLDLWLMVVVCGWLVDVALSAQLNAGRFDLGFYAGRIYGLLAGSFVLLMLLLENSKLYAQLRAMHSKLAAQNKELQQEITVRKSAEAALQEACEGLEHRVRARTASLEAALKEMESFTYSVSHDLKVPLRAVLGFVGILKADYGSELRAEARHLVQVIDDNARKMQQLIDDLLAFSHVARKPVAHKHVDMEALVKAALDELLKASDKPVILDVHKLPPCYGERALLKQVWVNLLSNAIKFSAGQAQPAIEVNACEDEAESIYFVRDNGVGFNMQYYDKLFGVFQRLHSPEQFSGTGVGLAIVQRIVSRHGGRVWAESKVGQGATFYFSLPKGDVD